MELSDVKILVNKYLDGETSLAEERALAHYLESCEELSDELRAVKVMLGVFASERAVVATNYPMIVPKPKPRFALNFRRIASVAAAACVVVVAFLVAYDSVDNGVDNSLVCYVDGVMVDDEAQALKESEKVVDAVFSNVNMALLAVSNITSGVSK